MEVCDFVTHFFDILTAGAGEKFDGRTKGVADGETEKHAAGAGLVVGHRWLSFLLGVMFGWLVFMLVSSLVLLYPR